AGLQVFAPPRMADAHTAAAAAPAGARLKMGVPGLDEMMGGGLPRGYSLLVEGARGGQTGVIAAFEQRPNRSRGPVMADLISSGRVGVIDARAPGLSV